MSLPLVIAGPIPRRVDAAGVTVWLVTSRAVTCELRVSDGGTSQQHTQQVGEKAFIHLLHATPTKPLAAGEAFSYSLVFTGDKTQHQWQQEQAALLYPDTTALTLRWQSQLSNVLHGSCRKPHYNGADSLLRMDDLIAAEFKDGTQRPDLLLLTGDQIYADDVAGPMLHAIQQTIDTLGLWHEPLEGAVIDNSAALATHPHNLYEREQLLPKIATNTAISKTFFGAKKKPIFTSVNAQNHLISCAEMIAMYLLVWSDTLWGHCQWNCADVDPKYRARYQHELDILQQFSATLPKVRRAFAHMPVYMIFDDHDVTDDWNLTRGWEQEVYGHPLSKRIVGNALIAYWLCQGWGNDVSRFSEIHAAAQKVFIGPSLKDQEAFIEQLLDFDQWHYELDTSPPIQVLDTRTQRWRSESSLEKPSGLMDWEALCEFQQGILNHPSVIVVSAAPIYGVKLIEAIQRIFTFFGKALTVDAENWMAHKGTASVILNIFRHYKTPPLFIILSGDVHYSFVYDVRLRFRRNSPRIIQFTCSGIKNAFPDKLLRSLDFLNRALYAPWSPLNWFTKRRNMSVSARKVGDHPVRQLLNQPALGQLILNQTDKHTGIQCKALCNSGDTVEFHARDEVERNSTPSAQQKVNV